MTIDPDVDIRERLRAGDASALELIWERFAPGMHGYVAALVGRQAADDVVQDVLVTVAEQRERVADADELGAYLMRMARNRALDLLRRDARRGRPASIASAATAPEHVSSVDAEAITAALAQLPDEQREVVALKIDAELTFAAIGEVLGIPANTAASRYRYALEKLQRLLPGERP